MDESNYDLGIREIPDNWWRTLYKSTLVNFEAARKLIPGKVLDSGEKQNKLAMVDVMEVYVWTMLVNSFGDVPYSEALDPNNFFPKYDDAKTIFYDLLARLDKDIATLSPAAAGFGSADLMYGGDVSGWIKFVNPLKLRMGITISDVDAKASSVILSAAPGAFTSNSDNAALKYLGTPPNTNPVYVDLVQGGRNDFVPANTIVNLLNGLNDPRRPLFFTTINGVYKGGVPGIGNGYATLSHVSDKIKAADAPATIINYAEVEFILAEAVERGIAVGGTAQSHYDKAVTASILDWGGSASDAATYLAQPSVHYATAAGTFKQKMGIQKYIALYNRGFDAWVEQRRLDYPPLVAPATALSAYPVRLSYPAAESNLNSTSYNAAVAKMGGTDKVTTELFWDKF